MEQINELRDIVNGSFGWNKARITCFIQALKRLPAAVFFLISGKLCSTTKKIAKGTVEMVQ